MRRLLLTACLLSSTSVALAQPSGAEPRLSDYAYHPATGDQPERLELPSDTGRRAGGVWAFRAGTFSGSGKATPECEGSGCVPMEAEGFDEESAFMLSADALGNASRNFRLGVGFTFIPRSSTKMNGQRYELGSITGLDFVAEGVFDLSKSVALTLRGSAGVSVLFPSGELEAEARHAEDLCATYLTCEVDPGPYAGVQAGLGAGLLFNLGRVGLRIDFLAQAYTFRVLELKVGDSTGDTELAVRLTGVRPMLLAGVEL